LADTLDIRVFPMKTINLNFDRGFPMKTGLISFALVFLLCSTGHAAERFINYTNASNISALTLEGGSYLWAGCRGGVVRWNLADGTYEKFTKDDGLASNYVNAIVIDADGIKWFGCLDGLTRFDGTSWTTIDSTDGLTGSGVSTLEVDLAGNLWAGNSRGLHKFDGRTWTHIKWTDYSQSTNYTSFSIDALTVDKQGNLWCGSFSEVTRYDGINLTNYTSEHGLAPGDVQSLAVDREGGIWCGTTAGVSVFDGESWTAYDSSDGLIDNNVQAVAIDSSGNKWFGTPLGVSRFDGSTWTSYDTTDGLAYTTVYSIAADPEGNMWFGSSPYYDSRANGALSKFDGTSWTTYFTNDIANSGVAGMAIDSSGNKWFCFNWSSQSSPGVSKFDGTDWTSYSKEDGLPSTVVYDIAVDFDGTLWFAGYMGITKYDGSTWTVYDTTDGLLHTVCTAVEIDSKGNKWFGSWGGVSKFDGTNWTHYADADGAYFGRSIDIVVDRQDNVWVWDRDGGPVYSYDGTAWTEYTNENGLRERASFVNAIAADPAGGVWFGYDYYGYVYDYEDHWGGVSRYDGTTWTHYTEEDGLASNYVRNIAIDNEGNKWFGTSIYTDFDTYTRTAGVSGVSKFDGTSWTTYTAENGLLGIPYVIAIDPEGNKWFGTISGVSMLTGEGAPPGPQPVKLVCESATAAPGAAAEVAFTLENPMAVSGFQFVIAASPANLVEFSAVTPVGRAEGWIVSTNNVNNKITVLSFSESGDNLEPGSGVVLNCKVDVSPDAPEGDIDIGITEVMVMDTTNSPVEDLSITNGKIEVSGEGSTTPSCDFNGDDYINIADVITLLLYQRDNPGDPEGDFNGDGTSDINDVLAMLLAQRNGTCPDAGVMLAAANEIARVEGLNANQITYLEEVMPQLKLTKEEEATFRLALYGPGSAALPKAFSLAQNVPNPFNPSTTISYSVPEGNPVHVSLKLYDIRGRQICTLVDELRDAGVYNVFWDGTDEVGRRVSSGVYFYRIQAGDFVQTRKMVLLK
jgi:ligand-binding sensor domain-containing protein